MDRLDQDGTRLPIKIDSTSNGEFEPIPVNAANELGNKLALEAATTHARRTAQSRRQFLISSCGAASTLLAFNKANAAHDRRGGYFEVMDEAALDPAAANAQVGGGEFIFDVQGHYVNPEGDWLSRIPPDSRPYAGMEKASCEAANSGGNRGYLGCLGQSEFIKDVFLDSDTDIMVLSFVPSTRETEPVTIEDADQTRQIVAELEGSKRLMIHGRVNPNQDGDLEAMDELAENWNICIHKGLPFGPQSYEHSQCSDIGVVARDYPDMNFLIYHSGFVAGNQEQAFAEGAGNDGIDTLIQSLLDNEVPRNSNVYAELGSTWRFLMRDPDNAAHALGKLFRYVGEDNVLWGTDSIWYGSPQDQIQAFRTFQISEQFQEEFGYPEITPELRRKVFGLNAAVPYGIDEAEIRALTATDFVSTEKLAYQEDPQPSFLTYGPKTRREFLNFLRWGG
jgi:predicted TIM-barrel fold metal-dependent hydrolase